MDKKVEFYNHLARSLVINEIIFNDNEHFELIGNFYTKIFNLEDYIRNNLKEMYKNNPDLFITYTMQYFDPFDFETEIHNITECKYFTELDSETSLYSKTNKLKKILAIEKISIYNLSCKMLERG